jgi:hypothetical protein
MLGEGNVLKMKIVFIILLEGSITKVDDLGVEFLSSDDEN